MKDLEYSKKYYNMQIILVLYMQVFKGVPVFWWVFDFQKNLNAAGGKKLRNIYLEQVDMKIPTNG